MKFKLFRLGPLKILGREKLGPQVSGICHGHNLMVLWNHDDQTTIDSQKKKNYHSLLLEMKNAH